MDELNSVYFQVRPLPLCEEEVVTEIMAQLDAFPRINGQGLNPGLIIIDTLSQFMMGGDENGSDMALLVSNARRLSQERDVAVLLIHHGNATGLRERGHTALRGNVDAMFQAKPYDVDDIFSGLKLLTNKQRDSAKADGLAIEFREVEGTQSLVCCYDEERNARDMLPIRLASGTRRLLQAFEDHEGADEAVEHSFLIVELELEKQRFYERLKVLVELKLVKLLRKKSSLTFLGRKMLHLDDDLE